MPNEFKIGGRWVGDNHEPYFVADIGANHDGSIERAFNLIELAKESGADAAKFQNFKAHKIVSNYGFENLQSKLAHQSSWQKSVFDIYHEASINTQWTVRLKEKCKEVGIEYFTSPYDFESVDHVDEFVNVYKIGSGDITWLDIMRYIASKGKPILLATGASDMVDVDRAMAILAGQFNNDVCLMQCNTNYTLDSEKYKFVNLNVLDTFRQRFPNVVLGLSDHTVGHATVVGSIAKGARVIEKHFTDDNDRVGPDHKFAMNPKSWKLMVETANEVFEALGDGVKRVEENEIDARIVQRRSLRATRDLSSGTVLAKEHLEALRPFSSGALEPFFIGELLGKSIKISLKSGEHITTDHIE
jgi:sialic acid synthase SpsE